MELWSFNLVLIFGKKAFFLGEIEVGLVIKAGKIKECKFYGDFFSNEDLTILEKGLVGLKYQEGEIEAFFKRLIRKNILSV